MISAITNQINCPSTVTYGHIGTTFLVVLIFQNDQFIEIGDLIYKIHRENLATEEEYIAFGKECEKYRIGERSEKPRWYYYNDGLHF